MRLEMWKVCLNSLVVSFLVFQNFQSTQAGILDPFSWARSDRIEVNIPWLPCKFYSSSPILNKIYQKLIYYNYFLFFSRKRI